MAEFRQRYGTQVQCHAVLVASRWPQGFVCPGCSAKPHSTFKRKGLRYWHCSACREQTTATCGTIFQATKLPLTAWFLATHLLTQAKNNVSALELKPHLGVRYKTAWLMKHKLMQVMLLREAPRQLDGRVEIDDAYLGGELPGARTSLCASAPVVSNGRWCFQGVTVGGASHERTVAGGGAASVKLPKFRAVNALPGDLKTSFSGTDHSFDFEKYAHRYLAQVQYRVNRRFDLRAILARLLRASASTHAHPERVIRTAELRS